MERYRENKEDTQPHSSASVKEIRRDKECPAFGCSNTFYSSESTSTGIHFFFNFPYCPQRLMAVVT